MTDTNTQAARDALAKAIARDIFAAGDDGPDRARRVQFMAGRWPAEFALGGFGEESLAACIAKTLERLDRAAEGAK